MSDDVFTLLQHIADETWQATRDIGLLPWSCIAAGHIAQQAARYFGLPGHLQPVQALVANTAAIELIVAQVPPEQWPEEAWSVGTSGESRPERYPGHIVLTFPHASGTVILDPSLPQFTRPRLGVLLSPLVAVQPRMWPDGATRAVFERPGGAVSYEPYQDGGLYRTSPDWINRKVRYHRLVGRVVRNAKNGALKPTTDRMR
ncbi:hypothetical protein AB0B89_36560 [Sphaerisporangium sp. NPDC049002]|uniref:hypothetical protein n=1 Tax=Sphaerisporangium sp. NPDC049002 TaxID=3155392 RepID=UPI0033F514DA